MAIPEKRSEPKPTSRSKSSPSVQQDIDLSSKSHRLVVPPQPQYETRSHQPGIEALIEPQVADPDFLEQEWGDQTKRSWRLPWGWTALLALTLCGGGIWAFFKLKPKPAQENALQVEQTTTGKSEAEDDREARELILKIERMTREYYAATTVDELIKHIRHPERVRALMERHYQGQKITPKGATKRVALYPMTVNKRANFWYQDVRFNDGTQQQLVIEVGAGNQPKVDWESEACHQPMPWDQFIAERPVDTPMNFRVFVRPDNFFSHEFTDVEGWRCFALTTYHSDATLFGYAKADSSVAQYLQGYFQANPGKKAPVILKLNVPANTQSKRGVIIEQLVNTLWMVADPPESDK